MTEAKPKLNKFALSLLQKKQKHAAEILNGTQPHGVQVNTPVDAEVEVEVEDESESSSSASSFVADPFESSPHRESVTPPEEPVAKPRRLGRKPGTTRPLPRNAPGLRKMRALQRSSTSILRKRTTQTVVKHIVRKLLGRADVRFAAGSVKQILTAVEMMLLEVALKSGQSCLRNGRATLMHRHIESQQHVDGNPNLTHWTHEDYEYETARLEPSRFRNSRLHSDQHLQPKQSEQNTL